MRYVLQLVVAAFAAYFCTAQADGYVGVGADVMHEGGRPALSLRIEPFQIFAWLGNYALGAAYTVGDNWQVSLGAVYVKEHERTIGTHENFLIVVRYCETWCISFAHLSHGSHLGYKEDRPNGGLNILSIEVPVSWTVAAR